MKIPCVSVDQMREVDRIMVEEMGVSIRMMMENASKSIAVLARRMLGGSVVNKRIVVLCGKGNNGGDGLGSARHLGNFGAQVSNFLTVRGEGLSGDARAQYEVLLASGVRVLVVGGNNLDELELAVRESDLVIDGLIGYNLSGNPRHPLDRMIELVNEHEKRVLSVDVPSGLNGDTGVAMDPTINAEATLTLALPKKGIFQEAAKEFVGKIYLCDLSVPRIVYKKVDVSVPIIFGIEDVIEVELGMVSCLEG